MKIFVHRYELKTPFTPNASSVRASREGCLLRIDGDDGFHGFSDLHPWPEFGDKKLDEQLDDLMDLQRLPMVQQAIAFAKRDARARAAGEALWVSGVQIRNNFLINDIEKIQAADLDRAASDGFTTLKIKCGRDIEAEAMAVNLIAARKDFLVRLDFNGRSNAKAFERFMSLVHRASDQQIEYVEDPFRYDHEAWAEIQQRWNLGIDFEFPHSPWDRGEKPSANVLILKPSHMDVDSNVKKAIGWGLGITVTSSMGHPVGVMHAHAIAQDVFKKHESFTRTAGCLTLNAYQKDAFSEEIPVRGPFIGKPSGHGIGFDHLLENLAWMPISKR